MPIRTNRFREFQNNFRTQRSRDAGRQPLRLSFTTTVAKTYTCQRDPEGANRASPACFRLRNNRQRAGVIPYDKECMRNLTPEHRPGRRTGSSSAKAVVLLVIAAASAPLLCSQPVTVKARDALMDLLLGGSDGQLDVRAFPANVRGELQAYLRRYRLYRSTRSRPVTGRRGREDDMVYDAWAGYERRLAAASADPKAPALARAYVDDLRPCYEWEGFHECPEREAAFARAYLQANSRGPFTDYLRLLTAHRWLCAAEAYEYETQPAGAARSRKDYEDAITIAKRSASAMIGMAAQRLVERNSCFSRD
jgi:hypothetical protein